MNQCSGVAFGGGGWWGFFFNDTATTEIYTLSLHDALPISPSPLPPPPPPLPDGDEIDGPLPLPKKRDLVGADRSEEHTSELQSRPHISYAVFCLKKKMTYIMIHSLLN